VRFVAAAHHLRLKGMDTAIAALGRLVREGADVRLDIAGGAADAGWRALAARAGVVDRVGFLGAVEDMPGCYAAADAMLHPTRWDACSLVTLEAMASGLPVVTTHANGAAELLEDGVSGHVIPPDDPEALADRMRLLLDPGRRAAMGAAARAAALRLDLRDNLAAVEAALQDAAAGRRGGVSPR
jgi:glycosyltransferase involved in cell wall biosynthesis